MGLYNRFCKRFFAAVIIRLTAQSDSRAHPEKAAPVTGTTLRTTGSVPAGSVKKLRRNFVEAHTLPIRADRSLKEQSWNILHDSPGSVV